MNINIVANINHNDTDDTVCIMFHSNNPRMPIMYIPGLILADGTIVPDRQLPDMFSETLDRIIGEFSSLMNRVRQFWLERGVPAEISTLIAKLLIDVH
jgi:hypothetical protein